MRAKFLSMFVGVDVRERENEWEREISKVEVVFDEWSCYCEGMNEWWWLVDADDDEIDKLD